MEEYYRPRILVLAHLPPPIHGVTVINEALIRSEFLRDRFELDVLPMRFASDFSDIGSIRPRKFLAMLGVAIRLVWRLLRHRPDAVYMTPTPTGMSFVRDAMFALIIKLFFVRIVYHLHGKGIREEYERSGFYRLLYRWFFRNAHVIHLSEMLRDDVSMVVPPHHIHILPNGVEPPEKPGIEGRSGETGPPVILYLSNIRREKGIFVLLDALKLLVHENCDFWARIAGAPGDRKTMLEFERSCSDPILDGRLEYLGMVQGDGKADLYGSADIFVMPTLFEAFGLVVLEAMSYSIPVVCSDEGSLPSIVVDGETGLVTASGSANDLADGLRRLISDAPLRRTLGVAGQRRYRENFTQEKMEAGLADILQTCLGR